MATTTMREKLWRRVRANVPDGQILPWWALAARAMLYPVDFLFWRLSKTRGYQPESDTWLIGGLRYSSRALDLLAQAKGETYRVTRSGDTVVFERVHHD